MRIFLSTGEPSGDLHAANLIRSLRKPLPDAEFFGFGGPRMAQAGARLLYPLVDLAVMGVIRVLGKLPQFINLVRQADRVFRDEKPDAVILIDFPGFNWWIARMAKKRGIPVIYYVPPQLWAWAGWRVKKVRRFVDHVLCTLPFEPPWYTARGVTGADYVGHPYFDELAARTLNAAFLTEQQGKGGPVVALLPGSRTQEVVRNFPMMLRAAATVHREHPEVRFVVACLHNRHRRLAEAIVPLERAEGLPLELYEGRTPELIRIADCAWAVSGSVGLELMVEALPTVVLYKINWYDRLLAMSLLRVRFISLVNLLADEEVMPEYLTTVDVSGELATWALKWLNEPSARSLASHRLATLRDQVARPGASERAAERIAAIVAPQSLHPPLQGPHKAFTFLTSTPDR